MQNLLGPARGVGSRIGLLVVLHGVETEAAATSASFTAEKQRYLKSKASTSFPDLGVADSLPGTVRVNKCDQTEGC